MNFLTICIFHLSISTSTLQTSKALSKSCGNQHNSKNNHYINNKHCNGNAVYAIRKEGDVISEALKHLLEFEQKIPKIV